MRVRDAARLSAAGGARRGNAGARCCRGGSGPGGHRRHGARLPDGVRAVRRADRVGGRGGAAVAALRHRGRRGAAGGARRLAARRAVAVGADAPAGRAAVAAHRAARLDVRLRHQLRDRLPVLHRRAIPGGHRGGPAQWLAADRRRGLPRRGDGRRPTGCGGCCRSSTGSAARCWCWSGCTWRITAATRCAAAAGCAGRLGASARALAVGAGGAVRPRMAARAAGRPAT